MAILNSRSPKLIILLSALALLIGVAPGCSSDSPPAGVDGSISDGKKPTPDGNTPTPDGNTPTPDGNTPTPDGNTPTPDGNTPTPDGNTPTPDGNTPPPDQGVTPDIGTATPTAFRMNSLTLADPHVFLTACSVDLTTVLNGQINTAITGDADNDSVLDLNYVIVFRPLSQGATGGALEIADADCRTPHPPTACVRNRAAQPSLATAGYSNQTTGTCLGRTVGTTDVTSHTPTETTAPCFVSQRRDLTITIGGVAVRLRDAQIAGRYNSATAATSLDRGLVRGFITLADATSSTLPATLPLVGGRSLASLLCGAGTNSEADVHAVHGAGWWFFLEYTASRVTYTES